MSFFRVDAQTFQRDLRNFELRVTDVGRRAFLELQSLVRQSVVEGSMITGAPGQPVKTGFLRASWVGTPVSAWTWMLVTDTEYAPYIEDGGDSRGPYTLRSAVGGFHSVKMTVAGFDNLVRVAVSRATRGGRP